MATKTKTKTETIANKELTDEQIGEMSLFERLVHIRREFAGSQVGKSGVNDHGEFLYFELKDIKPVIDPILRKYHTLFLVTFPSGVAKGTLYNLDARDDQITFEFDMAHIKEPAKFRMNEAQACGAEQTYYRRYLYYLLLDIAPNDEFDGAPKAPAVPAPVPPVTLPTQKKPASSAERSQVKKALTDADGKADELQIKALKEALKALREVDPSQDEFIQEIALKTDGFTKIKRSACEQLIVTVQQMREQYLSENDGQLWEE